MSEALALYPSMTAYNCDEPLSIAVFGADERWEGAREEGGTRVLQGFVSTQHSATGPSLFKAADSDPAACMIAKSQYLADTLATTANRTTGVGERARCNHEGAQEQNRCPDDVVDRTELEWEQL